MTVSSALFLRRYRIVRGAAIALLAAALLAGAIAIQTGIFDAGEGNPASGGFVNVADGSTVPGAASVILRTNAGIDYTLKTSGLTAGHVIVIKALVFNQPLSCKGSGFPRCSSSDIAEVDVRASIVFVTGFVARQESINVRGQIDANDRSHASVGEGLTNPHGADIDFVVVDHGLPVAGLYNDQLTTVAGGCKDAPPGSGKPGENDCRDLQLSIHQISGD